MALRCALLASALTSLGAAAQPLSLGDLDGRNGFRVQGALNNDRLGNAVGSAGDINGDGIDDLIVGAYSHNVGSGAAYVVFGRRDGQPAVTSVADLDGSNGFKLESSTTNAVGTAVNGGGDFNGDGLDDLIVGAAAAGEVGRAFVVYGRSSGFPAVLALDQLGAGSGLVAEGIGGLFTGFRAQFVGDFNGDGLDDVLFSSEGLNDEGVSYLILGSANPITPLSLATLSWPDGFAIAGAPGELALHSGRAGDINADGLADLIIGASSADLPGMENAGRVHVVFGSSAAITTPLLLPALNGSNGFTIEGLAAGDRLGSAVGAAGDVNGDGLADLLFSALNRDVGGQNNIGESYVVYGRSSGFPALLSLASLDGSNGFNMVGEFADDRAGYVVAGAGDVNADGIDDFLISAPEAAPGGQLISGRSYLVLGRREGFPAQWSLGDLDPTTGWIMDGENEFDFAGDGLAGAGDVDGDGVDDLLIGARHAENLSQVRTGTGYLVRGRRDRIHRDGSEDLNLDRFHPRLSVRRGFIGSAVRWDNGADCRCDDAPFDFNLFQTSGQLAFFWPNGGSGGGVINGGQYALLQAGNVVGPASNFATDQTSAATANWRAGVDGHLGFRFVDPGSGQTRYGYARLRTTAPTGYPVRVEQITINLTGMAVVVRAE
ncbi:MAG: hypothetical protein R3F15_08760 [Lysobacterales bacterium]